MNAAIFYRMKTDEIAATLDELRAEFSKNSITETEDFEQAEIIFIVGGDGAMLEAARLFSLTEALLCGINRGTIGFLAAINRGESLINAVAAVANQDFMLSPRFMVEAKVIRNQKEVFSSVALNDIVVTSPLSVVSLEVSVDDSHYVTFRGSGMLVSTPTGSTAYNLAAHGPIMTPETKGMIVTELLDHKVPTPSLVLDQYQHVVVDVGQFRAHKQLKMISGEPADVVVSADGAELFSLQPGDKITVSRAPCVAKFISFRKADFFHQIREKFEIT
ncbi:NAD(+)/NADH kinase [Candidatus Saccharibacteria bacterium]|jgi:NAD+ kinase|nr:NAD(+)/NADH kinase [Candidatus Saccharibacteria bacterium]